MTLWDQTAADLLKATASHKPTPGGGSIAALSGAFGVGLLSMALTISRNKARKAGQDLSPELSATLDRLQTIQARLQALADEDVAVFRKFVDATKLPKDSDEEQQARADALAAAGEAARATPLEIATQCVQALAEAEGTVTEVHAEVVSDIGAGAALLRGAIDAALLTVDINLLRLSEEEKAPLQTRRDELAQQGQERAARLLKQAQKQIAENQE